MDPFTVALIIQMVIAAVAAAAQAQKQKQVAKQQAQAANDQVAQRWKEQQKEEKARQEKLKVDLASKRARLGSQGLSAADGSAGAIIQGMRNEAAEDSYESFQTTKKEADKSLAAIQSNLLEASNSANSVLFGQANKALGGIGGSLLQARQKGNTTKRDPASMVQGLASGEQTPTTSFIAEKS